jgi:NADPH-dependent curcumin reductase CurA
MRGKVNRQWRLAARPVGLIKESDFEWHEEPIPTLSEGEILVRNIYLSLDPANRGGSERSNHIFRLWRLTRLCGGLPSVS